MKDTIFREYDIRGIVGSELMLDDAYRLGRAIVTLLQQKHPDAQTLVIGRDGRHHSEELHDQIVKAVRDHGINVITIGIVPTPVVYFAVHHFNTPLALAVTASHNPKEYNGIKIWNVWGEKIQTIKKYYRSEHFSPLAQEPGTIRTSDGITPYIDYLADHFSHLKKNSFKALVDCGSATGGTVYPALIKAMEWDNITTLYDKVDGDFPYHEADPTVMNNMRDLQASLQKDPTLQLGIGLDGDCDRMAPLTPQGTLVPGDKLLGLFAQTILKKQPDAPIICDIKSSGALFEFLDQYKATYHISPSGHSIIKEEMLKHNGILAGELSCHFFFKDRYFGYDDGIYASLRLIELLVNQQTDLDTLLTQFPTKESSPEIRIPCSSDNVKNNIVFNAATFFAAQSCKDMMTIDGIRIEQEYGWGLIRASNTQPALCLRFESESKDGLARIKEDFMKALSPHFDEQLLKEYLEC
jgi:phosphomannomutase/phosphoglucomutase